MAQWIGIILVVILIFIAALACNALLIQAVWNYLIASALDLPDIPFKVALGVALLFLLLGGGSSATVRRAS